MSNVVFLGVAVEAEYSDSFKLVSFVNPYSLLEIAKSEITAAELAEIRFYSDGIALCWIARAMLGKRIGRYSFDYTSLAGPVFESAMGASKRVALIGGVDGVVDRFAVLLREKYPLLRVVYATTGHFASDSCKDKCLDEIMACGADLVVVGMGAVKQEQFMLRLKKHGFNGHVFSCGGFFDQTVLVGGGDYYPAIVNRLHARWLYRLVKEPRRLSHRYLIEYPRFLVRFFQYRSNRPE